MQDDERNPETANLRHVEAMLRLRSHLAELGPGFGEWQRWLDAGQPHELIAAAPWVSIQTTPAGVVLAAIAEQTGVYGQGRDFAEEMALEGLEVLSRLPNYVRALGNPPL